MTTSDKINGEILNAGSLEAIVYEIRNGDFFTALDEVLHAFDFLIGNFDWRFNYCQWAHLRRDATQQARAGDGASALSVSQDNPGPASVTGKSASDSSRRA